MSIKKNYKIKNLSDALAVFCFTHNIFEDNVTRLVTWFGKTKRKLVRPLGKLAGLNRHLRGKQKQQ
jgi:hypothetical protein